MNENMKKQWKQDLIDYGDKSHLLYLINFKGAMAGAGWEVPTCNNELIEESKQFEIKRKESAALPFDLERAKAGDAMEWIDNGKLHQVLDFKVSERADYADTGIVNGRSMSFFSTDNLRMKYPPRAKP